MTKIACLVLFAALGLCSCSTTTAPELTEKRLSPQEPIQIMVSMSIRGLTDSEKNLDILLNKYSKPLPIKDPRRFPSILMLSKQVATIEIIKERLMDIKATSKTKVPPIAKAPFTTVVEGFRNRLYVAPEDGSNRYEGILYIGDISPNGIFSSVLIPYSGIAKDGKEIVIPARSPSGNRIKIYMTFRQIDTSGKPVKPML